VSSYAILREVSQTLKAILWNGFEHGQPGIFPDIIQNSEEIVFKNPTETARDSANRLSVWLYQITENEFVKNQPMVRTNGSDRSRFPPLALNLSYLITPFADSEEKNLLLLGRTMQILYDNASYTLQPGADGQGEEIHIVFARMTLEELTRIWEALRESYRLSVCYQLRVTRIESQRTAGHGRVVERAADFEDESAQGRQGL
jgi:hypothetical protein